MFRKSVVHSVCRDVILSKFSNAVLLLIFSLLVSMSSGYANTYYWVGGSGAWTNLSNWSLSSGGTIPPGNIPSPADNVIIDDNSFGQDSILVINLNLSVISFKDLICTNPQAPIVFSGGSGAQILKVYGSLQLSNETTFMQPQSLTIDFESQQTGNIISTHNTFIRNINFQGLNGGWRLESDLLAGNINFYYGQLDFDGFGVEADVFYSMQPAQRSLLLSDSEINITNWQIAGAGISLDAGTSLLKTDVLAHSGNAAYHNVVIGNSLTGDTLTFNEVWADESNVQFNGYFTYNTLHLGGDYVFSFNGSHTFTQDLIAEGIDCSRRLTMLGAAQGTPFYKSSGVVTANNTVIENIHAGGGAVFTADNSYDGGNNTGWSFSVLPPRNLYWVGGSGLWSDPAHWSLTSGGPGGECIPTRFDNVFFDTASFAANDTLTLDSIYQRCYDMMWDIYHTVNITVSFTPSAAFKIYGSLQWDNHINWLSQIIEVEFKAETTGKTIRSNGSSFPSDVYFLNEDGEWSLLDDMTAGTIYHEEGVFITSSHKLTLSNFISNGGGHRSIYFGNSLVELIDSDSEFFVQGVNMIFSAGNSLIRFLNEGAFKSDYSTVLDFYDVEFVSGFGSVEFFNNYTNNFNRVGIHANCSITGSFNVNHLTLFGNHTYNIAPQSSVNINDSIVFNSGCQAPLFLKSLYDSTVSYIHKASGIVEGENLILKDVHATGGASFNAIASVDLGNNNGWQFTPHLGTDLYWVNGSGNWSDSNHWSYSSGGSGGACIPTPLDNVIFDHNSFNYLLDTVLFDVANGFCFNMTWQVDSFTPIFLSNALSSLHIFGSLTLDSSMFFNHQARTYFLATQNGHTIESAGNAFSYHVFFDGQGGEWSLLDTFKTTSIVYHFKGSLILNNQLMEIGSYLSYSYFQRALDMTNSELHIKLDYYTGLAEFNASGNDFNLKADSSEMVFWQGAPIMHLHTNDSLKFWHVSVLSGGSTAQLNTLSAALTSTFRRFYCHGDMAFMGYNYFDTLILAGPAKYSFSHLNAQKINELVSISDCNERIEIVSTDTDPGLIFNSSGSAPLNDCDINNVIIQGGSTISVQNGTGQGNTSGWDIIPVQPLDLYWVNGSGNWDDPIHWAYTSGGAGNACVPTAIDNVFFDQNSFTSSTDTVTLNVHGFCNNMTWDDIQCDALFRGPFGVTNYLNVHGFLIFDTLMTTERISINFLTNTPGQVVSTHSKTINNVNFNGNGVWELESGLNAVNIILTKGHLYTQGHPIYARVFRSTHNNQRTLDLSNSTCSIQNSWLINANQLTFNSGTSNIVMHSFTINPYYFQNSGAGALEYYNLHFASDVGIANLNSSNQYCSFNSVHFAGSGEIMGTNNFDTLSMSPGNSYIFDTSHLQTIGNYWRVRGNNCYPINLRSNILGTQAEIHKASGVVSGDFLHIRDINASGNTMFFAGENSSNTANNSGWIFNNQPGYTFGLGNDTIVCSTDPLVLTTDNFNGGEWFLWSDSSTGPTLSVYKNGTYWVEVYYSDDCYVTDTIQVTFFEPVLINFPPDTTICEGDTLILKADGAIQSYLWNNGSHMPELAVSQSGIYSLTITDSNNCNDTDSIEVTVIEIPRPDLGNNTYLCMGDSIMLDAGDFDAFLWHDYSTDRHLIVKDEGVYWVDVTGQCGKGRDSIYIWLLDCDFLVPNVFTPDGDGINDFLEVVAKEIENYELTIFNRWGREVFRSNSLDNQWDGTYKGRPCPAGVYYWTASYIRTSNFGEVKSFKSQGAVTLIR